MTTPTDAVILTHPTDEVPVTGHWIWDRFSEGPPEDLINCLFRRRFDASELGEAPTLRISADSRYKAYLNGELISRGPCRGTLEYYNYETIDLTRRLRAGENVLAVEVRWYGKHFPQAEIHRMPGLWAMLGGASRPDVIVTDASWKLFPTDAYAPDPIPAPQPLSSYCVVDPCEDIDLRRLPLGWTEPDFDDASWARAATTTPAYGRYQTLKHTHWYRELAGRTIPPLEETPVAPAGGLERGRITLSSDPRRVRSIEGDLHPADEAVPAFWADPAEPLTFGEPGTHYVIVNMGELLTGYPHLTIEAPSGTMVEYRYSEALSRDLVKGVRDDPAAGTVEGYFDLFTTRAGDVTLTPFVWRTFRFLRIAVHHPNGTATLKRLRVDYTAYPFRQAATFESAEPLHRQLWDLSWRTARLCAHEHYEDCPFYEQLQYVGDTRLQALISYMIAGDFRLARQALRQWGDTRRPDGITKSRTPSNAAQLQIIPQFSLIWIHFLEDFFRYSGDVAFVAELFDGVEGVLKWFDRFAVDDVCEDVPYWVFTDWSYPRRRRWCGSMGELNLQRIGALQATSRLAEAIGETKAKAHYARKARRAAKAVREAYYSKEAGLFLDERDGTLLGEHPSLLAILYGVVSGGKARALLRRVEKREDLARTTIYYSYYTFRTYDKLGRWADAYRLRRYLWTEQLALHATTWFEKGPQSRSDCHAWGAWIMCDLMTSLLGLQPAAPGFARVRVAPNPMGLPWARGTMPTVRGTIAAAFERDGDAVRYTITLPAGVDGALVAPDGTEHTLTDGENTVTFTEG
ncbi:MAG: alpha-L-rhamnosidase C-terminal domain-containing protein [Planctomycetota bacterium]